VILDPDTLTSEDLLDTRDLNETLDYYDDPDNLDEYNELSDYGKAVLIDIRDASEAGISDWPWGETLIADYYFVKYAIELAYDIGAINDDYHWPASHIDWDAAAEALQQDYTSIEIGDGTYWARY
jgi:hypothetical protein